MWTANGMAGPCLPRYKATPPWVEAPPAMQRILRATWEEQKASSKLSHGRWRQDSLSSGRRSLLEGFSQLLQALLHGVRSGLCMHNRQDTQTSCLFCLYSDGIIPSGQQPLGLIRLLVIRLASWRKQDKLVGQNLDSFPQEL